MNEPSAIMENSIFIIGNGWREIKSRNIFLVSPISTFSCWWKKLQSNPVFWNRLNIFAALPWPNRWFYWQRVVIRLWVDILGYNMSKNQLPRSKTVASSLKKVHFWKPIWRTPSALWNGPSPISLSFFIWSRWDLVCQSTFGSSWLVPNLIKFSKELAEI